MRYFAVGDDDAGRSRFVLAEFAILQDAQSFCGDVAGTVMSEADIAGSDVLEAWRRGDSRHALQARFAGILMDAARDLEGLGGSWIDEALAHDEADVEGVSTLRVSRELAEVVQRAREIVEPYARKETGEQP